MPRRIPWGLLPRPGAACRQPAASRQPGACRQPGLIASRGFSPAGGRVSPARSAPRRARHGAWQFGTLPGVWHLWHTLRFFVRRLEHLLLPANRGPCGEMRRGLPARVPWHVMHVSSLWHEVHERIFRRAWAPCRLEAGSSVVWLDQPAGWKRRVPEPVPPAPGWNGFCGAASVTPLRSWQDTQKVCPRWQEAQLSLRLRASWPWSSAYPGSCRVRNLATPL